MLSVDKYDHLRYSECFFFHSSGEGCSNQIFWSTLVLEKLICFCKWTSRKPKAWFCSQYSEMPGKLTSISPAAEAITQKYESGVGVGIQEIQNSWERLGADTGLGGGEYDALVENLRRHSHTQALILHLHNPVRAFLKTVPWPLHSPLSGPSPGQGAQTNWRTKPENEPSSILRLCRCFFGVPRGNLGIWKA